MDLKQYYEYDYADKEYYEFNKPRITTVEDWKKILSREITYNPEGFDFIQNVLVEAYYAPNRTIFCGDLEEKTGIKGINLRVGEFRDRIRKYNVIEFEEQIRDDSGTDRAWNIPFYSNEKLNNVSGKFSWVLRDELSKAMEELGLVSSDDTRVMTFPINGTEEIIEKYKIHAHPVKKGYPIQITPFIAFRTNGGIIEKVYKVKQIKECFPSDIQLLKDQLSEQSFSNLSQYVQERYDSFGFGELDVEYRFYFLEEYKTLLPQFVMYKNNQNAKVYDLYELISGKEHINRILFCNVAYMKHYDFSNHKEVPVNGGQNIIDTGDAFEKYNFHRCEDGTVKGFVETKYVGGAHDENRIPKQLHIENIDLHYKNLDEIDNVTVVFCAKNPAKNVDATVIVGWYRNAKVYRYRKEYLGRPYNIEADFENVYLIPDGERNKVIPRAKENNENIGFGQANVWYANKKEHKSLVNEVLNYINDYSSKKLKKDSKRVNAKEDDELNEEINANKIQKNKYFNYSDELILRQEPKEIRQGVTVYKRDRQKAINAISHSNFQCEINPDHLSFVKKSDGLPYMEAHHLIPMAQQDLFEYSLDVEENIVSLCSQCHNEIHYGENADRLITKLYHERIELLKKKKIYVSLEELLSYYGF